MVQENGSLIQLSPDHEQVSTQNPQTGVWDWAMKAEIPEGVEWVMKNGQFLVAKLGYNVDGGDYDELPGTARLAIAYEAPGDVQPQIITPEISYRPFANLTPTEQRDSDYRTEDLKIFFKSGEVSFTEDTPLYVMVKTDKDLEMGLDSSNTGIEYDTYLDFNVREFEL